MGMDSSRIRLLSVNLIAAFLFFVVSGSAQEVFFDDFDGGQVFGGGVKGGFSGVTNLTSVQGFAGLGDEGDQFGGNFLRNDTGGSPIGTPSVPTMLTLTDLPDHDVVNIEFLLGVLESWDGSGAPPSGDFINVRVGDGLSSKLIFSETFSRPLAPPQSYEPPDGVLLSEGKDLGSFGIVSSDSAYDMGSDPTFHQISHSSSTLVVEWFADGPGYQGGGDESWAIENVRIALSILLGDVNCDGEVNLLDVDPFIDAISSGEYNAKADINQDGVVNLLDVDPFIAILSGG